MEQKPKPSHTGRWIALAVLALPLLYVLSVPWVGLSPFGTSPGMHPVLVMDPFSSRPHAFDVYATPYQHLRHTFAGPWLDRYDVWCFELYTGKNIHPPAPLILPWSVR